MDFGWQKSSEFWHSPEAGKISNFLLRTYEIGKKILILLIGLILKFPNTALGIFAGATIGFFISIIPLIGWILEPVVKPVCIITGGIIGFLNDRENQRQL